MTHTRIGVIIIVNNIFFLIVDTIKTRNDIAMTDKSNP